MARIGDLITHIWVRGAENWQDTVEAEVNRYVNGKWIDTPETVAVIPNYGGQTGTFAVQYRPESDGTYKVTARSQTWHEYVWEDIVQIDRPRPNATIFHIWEVDLPGAASRLETTLYYYAVTTQDDPAAPQQSDAAEPVAVVEIPDTNGSMQVSYAPENTGVYKLRIFDPTTFREYWWEDHVSEVIQSSEDDSYCALRDVERHSQLSFDSGTNPTDAQVLLFMAHRASIIYARMGTKMGDDSPGPVSYPGPHFDPDKQGGIALQNVCRDVNAIGAAADAIQAAGAGEGEERTLRVQELEEKWTLMLEEVANVAVQYATHDVFVGNHITSGTTTESDLEVELPIKF